MDEYISRAEHEEYTLRMDQEHRRINHRIEVLENHTQEINRLQISIEKLIINVESMVKEQKAQGIRLEALESKDGKMWRQSIGYIISAIVGAAVTFIINNI